MITKDDKKAIINQLNQIEITNGKGIFQIFRNKIKKIFNIKYTILTNNGTSALYLAYKSIGLKNNDEVITGTYTFHATNSTLLNFTTNIKFCDYNEDITISIEEIKKNITNNTKLLIIPHTWGLATNMESILKFKRKYKNLFIIEDCSQAHFVRYKNKLLGTFGDIGVFSMQGGKILKAGEGGFVITNNKNLYENMLVNSDSGETLKNLLKKDSIYNKYIETGLGFLKFRPNPLGIALANSQLNYIFKQILNREIYYKLIKKELKNIKYIKFPIIKNMTPSYYGVIGIYKKDLNNNIDINKFIKLLQSNGIFDIYKPQNNKPNHLLPIFKEKIIINKQFKQSEYIYNNLLLFRIYNDIRKIKSVLEYILKFKRIIKKYDK